MIYDLHIFVCTNQRTGGEKRSCGEEHGHALVSEFKKKLKEIAPALNTRANRSGCLGICDFGPTVAVYPEGVFYVGVELSDVEEIVRAHIGKTKPVERLLLRRNDEDRSLSALPSGELFEDFRTQLAKDLGDAGMPAAFTAGITADWNNLKATLASVIRDTGNEQGRIARLLNRVDISEAQLKKYMSAPKTEFADALAELIIKRVLQKVVLKKKFSQ